MQCCPAGAWGSGPWNAGAGEQTQPRSGSLESTMFFWDSQNPCLMGYSWAVAPPWTCKEAEELLGQGKSYSSASSGALPPCFTGVVGNADWATSPRVPSSGTLSPCSITQLCEQQQLSELSVFVCRWVNWGSKAGWPAKVINKITMKADPFNS